MKNREFLETVANGTINEEVKDYAKEALAKLDAANEKRREKPTKATLEKRAANVELGEKIYEILTDSPIIVSDLIEALGGGLTPQRVNYAAGKLVEAGRAKAVDVKVPTKGKQRGYIRA